MGQGLEPTVTLCTDASLNPHNKVGAWACYIRSGDKRIKTSGVIKTKPYNSDEAERIGLANALWLVDKTVDLSKHKLIVYCDSKNAMTPPRITNKSGKVKQRARTANIFHQMNIQPILDKAKSYELRWVKGHADERGDKLSTREFMNVWCDEAAKKARIEFEEKLKEEYKLKQTAEYREKIKQEQIEKILPEINLDL